MHLRHFSSFDAHPPGWGAGRPTKAWVAAALACAALVGACSPTYDWREARSESGNLRAMLPCKPERASRPVALDGREVSLKAMACEAGGATFAVFEAQLMEPGSAGKVLSQWNAVTLARLRSTGSSVAPFRPAGAFDIPQSVQVRAVGRRPDGSAVQSHAAYFGRGTHVFQAVIYAQAIRPEMAEPFFGGLKVE